MRPSVLTLAVLVASSTTLAGCGVPLILGAAAGAGYVGLQDRPSKQVAADTAVKVRITDRLTSLKWEYLTDIGIDVFYGDVLLTGVLPSAAEGEQVLEVIRQTAGVKKVYNELFVGGAYTTAQKAKDAWISAQIQPRLIGTKDVFPLNYLITVVNNHVYVMGTTSTAAEKQHVLHLLRTTRGVQQVHDYLTILGAKGGDGRANVVRQPDIFSDSEVRAPNPLPETR